MSEDRERQENELAALESIFDDERLFIRAAEGFGGQLSVSVNFPEECSFFYPEIKTSRSQDEEKASTSDERANHQKLGIKHLPPIVLNFDLPPDYPSKAIPDFTLSCKWLPVQKISILCKALDEAFVEGDGNEILYEWTTILSEQTCDILEISGSLVLEVARDNTKDGVDGRSVQDIANMAGLVSYLIDYNQSEETRLFKTSYILCGVCFNEKFGLMCVQFHQCKHVFCKQCMAEYFTVQINDGSVKALICPEGKCETQADPAMVKSLVDSELFERYDKLLLQRTLECMSDITYCPRKACQAPVLREEDLDMARCPTCHFVFCILCHNTYHGRAKCPLSSEEMKKLRETYINGTEEEKEELIKKYGKKVFQRMIEEGYSEAWLERFSQKCPKCKAGIQKIDGCNKMTCFQCRTNFCWLCNAFLNQLNPYTHFNNPKTKCYNKLFEGIEQDFGGFEDGEEDEDGWIQFL